MTSPRDPAPPHEGRNGPHDDRDRPIGAVAGLIDQVHAIVYVDIPDAAANVGHRTIYLSRGVESVIGYTPAEILDDPDQWLRIVHPDDVGTVIERTIGHLTAPSTLSSEYRVISPRRIGPDRPR